jgi:phage-related minor tail protein
MASQYLARLGIVLGIDSGELVQGISDAKKQFHGFASQVEKDTKAAAREFEALRVATEDYGKTLTKVEQIQREIERGRFMFASQNVKDKLMEQARAYDAQAASMKKMNGVMTEQQRLQVGYQVTDFFTQVASGQNVLVAFLQQGGQLKDTMGGVGNAIKALGTIFTPFSVSLAAIGGYFATIAFAAYKADQELDKFNDTLALTGNFSRVTLAEFESLSREMAKASGMSIGNAKDALMELVASGKFTEQSIDAVQRAVLTFARVAGISGAEAAKELQSGLSGSAADAKSLNDKMNFLTLEQFKYIEALNRAGKTQEAAREVAIALTTQLELQSRQVGALEGAWKSVTKAFSEWFESTKEKLRDPTIQENLAALDKQIETIQNRMKKGGLFSGPEAGNQKILDSLLAQKESLQEIERLRARSESANKVPDGEKSAINRYEKAGGLASQIRFAEEAAKLEIDARFKARIASANEEQRIELELEQKKAQALQEERKRNEETFGVFSVEMARIRAAKVGEAEAEAEQKRIDLRKKRFIQELDAEINARRNAEERQRELDQKQIDAERNVNRMTETAKIEAEFQRDRLQMQIEMVGATEKQLKLAELTLETEKQIAVWKKSEEYNLLSDKDREFYEQQMRLVADAKKNNLELAESLRYVQGMYDAVWSNMSSAIEQFVRTGKLSIKDFTRSVIQDMLIMNMKLQAMTLIRGLLGSFIPQVASMSPSQYALDFGGARLGTRANGGPVSGGSPYLVGERGPELFMPSGSGTIVPNHMLANNTPVTNVTNNYINAIDAKSFEQRLLESNQAIWSANQYATKNMATNFGRT